MENNREQRFKLTLIALAFLSLVLIVIGIFTQSQGINADHILVPSFFFSCGLFFLFFGFNGVVKGQLIEKWTPEILYGWIKLLTRFFTKKKTDKENNKWKFFLGATSIFFGMLCIITGIYDLLRNFNGKN